MTELLVGIPDEVFTTEILAKRMDFKTLGKCSCVSKWWNKTLRSQEFIVTRRRHHPNSTHIFVDQYFNQGDAKHEAQARLRFSTGDDDRHDSAVIEFNVAIDEHCRRVLPVCRDLVCVEYSESIHICNINPLTRQTVQLPRLEAPTWHHKDVVFGYLNSLRKYVVVKVTGICGKSNAVVNKLSFDHVNDSSSDWKWETIKDVCPRMAIGGVFVENFIYWIISEKRFFFTQRNNNEGTFIVSLDVEKEKFGIINCPQTPQWDPHRYLSNITLIDFNGTLCLTDDSTANYESRVIKVWALKRELGQWEKKYNVELDKIGPRVWSLKPKSSMDGELIFSLPERGTWCLYNPNTEEFRIITGPAPSSLDAHALIDSVSFFAETWPPTKLH